MANIPFPNVPNAPGVPPIPRSPKFPPVATAALAILQGALWRVLQVSNQWGVYDSKGKALGDPSKFTGFIGNAIETAGLGATLSTSSVDYSKETKVADFPIEKGSFASYNKVETPANPIVTLALNGNEGDRRAFLNAIDLASKSTDLYSVVTPSVTYANYSIERYDYTRRADRGLTLLVVEITLKEIRQVSAAFSQSNKSQVVTPQVASASPTANNGKVQAATPRVSILKSLEKKGSSLGTKFLDYLKSGGK